MDFEVWAKDEPDVSFKIAPVKFPAFSFYKKQAESIAEQIRNTPVDEEHIQEAKKVVASARRISDELSRRRIDIKKSIMVEFNDFESQVKEIAAIIDDADSDVRSKIRELEEIERDQKKEKIRQIWDKRVCQYQIYNMLPDLFEIWLTPQHLNKTTSLKSVEADLVEWLEGTEKAIDTLKSMDDEYLVEYLGRLDLTEAIKAVNERNEIAAAVSEAEEEETATFIIIGTANIKLTEMLLEESKINFRRK